MGAIRAVLDHLEALTIPSHAASPILYVRVHKVCELCHLRAMQCTEVQYFGVRRACCGSLWTRRSRWTYGSRGPGAPAAWQGRFGACSRASRLAVMGALSRKKCELTAGVIKVAVAKVGAPAYARAPSRGASMVFSLPYFTIYITVTCTYTPTFG